MKGIMDMPNGISLVDRTALKFNQGSIITIVILAFALQLPSLLALLALVLIVGTIIPSAGLFKLLYGKVLRPLKLLRADVVEEDNLQHLFSQGLGGVFLVIAFAFLTGNGIPIVGWSLAFLVAALALVNLTVDFCLGCFLYLRLRRWSFFTRTFLKRVTNN
jgi:predicted permease